MERLMEAEAFFNLSYVDNPMLVYPCPSDIHKNIIKQMEPLLVPEKDNETINSVMISFD